MKHIFSSIIFMSLLLSACASVATPATSTATMLVTSPPTNEPSPLPLEITATPNQIGCVLPPKKISGLNVVEFFWSESENSITYRENNTQNWFMYQIISNQSQPVVIEETSTSSAEIEKFNINDYVDAFISPSEKTIVFSREVSGKYAIYYTYNNEEIYLGLIQGQIDTVDWFDGEEKAILAIDWQSPAGAPEASVYLVDFLKNEILIGVPTTNDFYNIEYLGFTPDEKQLMLVSYAGKNRNLILRNILTTEIFYTPIFKPLDFKWISEKEFIGVGYQDPGAYPFASVFVYNIEKNEINVMLDAKIKAERYLYHSIQISPDGSAIAYVDDESRNLYWVYCSY